MNWQLGILVGWVVAPLCGAATFQEDFSNDPLSHGWRIVGETNLFEWDTTNQLLHVTWDSSKTNSYFYHPLDTILSRDDDFQLSFDLELDDYLSGTTPGQPYAFPLALGFLNLVNATQTNFFRGSGINALYGADNLVEFNFFPAFDIFQPTIAQVIVSTNNAWLYNHDNLLDMPPGDWFHIDMNYQAASRTLTTLVWRNGIQYGVTQTIQVPANSFDFRTATVSVSSYNDQHADGSLLAHGSVDNIQVTVPPSPVQNLKGYHTNNQWQVAFTSQTNWLYTLEATGNFQTWNPVSSDLPGTGSDLFLIDTNPATTGSRFYRVRAGRP